ncbi:glycogen debranching protein [Nocardioides guangzhouensis]|uniref:glycogen debranching protein n=1 Tax=Nocardioides guangzhouensis TaxID=2497878 RepID=UPI001FED1A8E|nr:glycogen debranching protein [Nocardioides guangzhouensis]
MDLSGLSSSLPPRPVRPLLRRSLAAAVALAAGALVASLPQAGTAPAAAAPTPVVDGSLDRSPELSETTRLADRRFVVTGDRAWALGSADGRWPAAGFHTRGEMGGYWLPEVKLLDGVWFGIDDQWIGQGTRTTSGWGYVRTDLPDTAGVQASRTDVVPDGADGALVGLSLRSDTDRTISLRADAHSELLGSYPWGETQPSQKTENLPDTASVEGGHLLFRDQGKPPHPNAEAHDWAATFGSSLTPTATDTGTDFRGPQDPAVVCPASGPDAPPQPQRCDDTEYGKGAGGRLTYDVPLRAGEVRTVWFGIGGSSAGPAGARSALSGLLDDPAGHLAAKVATRQAVDGNTVVDLPGDRLLEQSIRWSKQMLAASDQRVANPRLRVVRAGKEYPPPAGTIASMRWLGAGWPDYPWLFGTDGEYTAFAAVAAGQFAPIKAHLRALRDVSEVVNGGSGKIVHEVTPDGAVYFGANADAGNTDESSKYPSAVAEVWRWTGDDAFLRDLYPASVKAMKYVATLDEDGDGWPEGLGNVEREGMGEEKLDNAVYTIRGYADLADMARARGDNKTRTWSEQRARAMVKAFEDAWWYDDGGANSYADSLDDPGNEKVFQRHWIGLTPTDAVLPDLPGRPGDPLASRAHGNTTLDQHEKPCFTNELGLFHTGTGPTSAPAGNPGASCDSVVSAVPSERSVFTLNSAIAAVSEGNYGRLGSGQQGVYTHGNARSQLDPSLWEMPGAMPEIVPGGDFGANINRLFTERSMVMQAWGAYGTLWPVVHQWLGVAPDLGRGTVAVVPQVPAGQSTISGDTIRLGDGAVDVTATRTGPTYTTEVTRHSRLALTIGAVLPDGVKVRKATLDGRPVGVRLVRTARGAEAQVMVRPGTGTSSLVVVTR